MSDKLPPAEILDITALAGKFKNRKELQEYAEMLFRGFKDSVERLQVLEEENKHLKLLLSQVPQSSGQILINVPDEQVIAEMQLRRLKETAAERELTLDETKRFDLLTKNLYLAKGKPVKALDAKSKRIEDELTDAELVGLAKTDE